MTESILSVEAIRKQYATVTAVDRLNFQIREGEIFALLGPNGAGKTSTVRMLIGITRPDSGRIRYQARAGEQAAITGPELGYLPEERGLYQDQPVLDVLVYFGRLQGLSRRDARGRATQWLERLDLGERATEKLGALSKGNQQKVQLISTIL
ncbi:ABC transporter ATP-binding protein, partial [Natronospira sp.]